MRNPDGVLVLLDDSQELQVYNLSEKNPIYLENTLLGLRMDLALDSSNKEIT